MKPDPGYFSMIIAKQEPGSIRFSAWLSAWLSLTCLWKCSLHFSFPIINFPSRLSSSDVALILGNLEEISTFQQMLVQSLEECTKLVSPCTHSPTAAASHCFIISRETSSVGLTVLQGQWIKPQSGIIMIIYLWFCNAFSPLHTFHVPLLLSIFFSV